MHTDLTPQVLMPKISRLELRHELGILYVLVDGETKLAMNTEQFIEFFQYAIKKAYVVQNELNKEQQRKGDPTVHCKTGGASLSNALFQRLAERIDVDTLAVKVAEHIRQKG